MASISVFLSCRLKDNSIKLHVIFPPKSVKFAGLCEFCHLAKVEKLKVQFRLNGLRVLSD